MFDLSFLIPKIVFQGSTRYSADIKVVQIGKTRKLIVNGLVQSFNGDSRFAAKKVWGNMAKNIAKNVPEIKNALLLGMGAGTMLKILNKELGREIKTTSVEIDETIVALAKKYFELDTLKNNKIIIADAFKVLENPEKFYEFGLEKEYDCIIVDTYLGSKYPYTIQTSIFLENLVKFASPNTFIIFNRVIEKKDKTTLEDFTTKLNKYVKEPKIQKVESPVISDNYLVYGYKLC